MNNTRRFLLPRLLILAFLIGALAPLALGPGCATTSGAGQVAESTAISCGVPALAEVTASLLPQVESILTGGAANWQTALTSLESDGAQAVACAVQHVVTASSSSATSSSSTSSSSSSGTTAPAAITVAPSHAARVPSAFGATPAPAPAARPAVPAAPAPQTAADRGRLYLQQKHVSFR